MTSAILATVLALASFQTISCARIPLDASDVGLNTVEMIQNHGYPVESHDITTEDGYILTYHRIPHGINDDGTAQRPAVLLMHGLVSSSADFVNLGPEHSLGYILADLGYDVWIGNARGNAWSRRHVTLDVVTDAQQFFDFSWHEIGYYDLPAAVDHILEITGEESISYVGHSQGTTSFMVFASTRPEYNDKIKIASLLAPAAYMEHQTGTLLITLAKYIYELEDLFMKYKIYELPEIDMLRAMAFAMCTAPENYNLCVDALGLIDGIDTPEMPQDEYAVILSNAPSNAGTKQLLHYGQLIKNGGFSQYDHGAERNLEIYGSEIPPAYDLSKIAAPVAVYYGKNDGLVNFQDAENVVKNLPNLADDYLVSYELFNHLDFIFAPDAANMVYAELINVMASY